MSDVERPFLSALTGSSGSKDVKVRVLVKLPLVAISVDGDGKSVLSATTCRLRICQKAACQALWVYASIQHFEVLLFTFFNAVWNRQIHNGKPDGTRF